MSESEISEIVPGNEPKIVLQSNKYRVVMGDEDLPDTWEVFEVQSLIRDQSLAESELRKTKATMKDHAVDYMQAVAFCAAKRRGLIDATATFALFRASCLEVTAVDVVEARPTTPAPAG